MEVGFSCLCVFLTYLPTLSLTCIGRIPIRQTFLVKHSRNSATVTDYSSHLVLVLPNPTPHHPLEQNITLHNQDFFYNRNWQIVCDFWQHLTKVSINRFPSFIQGDSYYGLSEIDKINEIGRNGEFQSKDYRYKSRKTYAMTIGYVGSQYAGFQEQRGQNVDTVEADLRFALRKSVTAAGRTDRGVSAISQVVNFISSNNDLNEEDFLNLVRKSPASVAGKIVAFECRRVPRKFNARSQATWRRYIYLFPLNKEYKDLSLNLNETNTFCRQEGIYDVDVVCQHISNNTRKQSCH